MSFHNRSSEMRAKAIKEVLGKKLRTEEELEAFESSLKDRVDAGKTSKEKVAKILKKWTDFMYGPVKAYWIFNTGIEMSISKRMVQACHGTGLIYENNGQFMSNFNKWVRQEKHHIKVFAKAENDKIFNKIIKKLKENNIKFFEIIDMGLTEFDGPTCTGIVIAPVGEGDLPGIVRHLPKLKDEDCLDPYKWMEKDEWMNFV